MTKKNKTIPPPVIDHEARAAIVTLAAACYHMIGQEGYNQIADMLKTNKLKRGKK